MPRPLSDQEVAALGLDSAPSNGPRPLSDDEVAQFGLEGPGMGESALRGAAQGATLGFADEITGGGEALLDKLRGAHEALGELYLKHRDESRAKYKAAQEANPVTYGAAELAGGVAPMLIPGVGGATAGARIAGAAGLGAAAGLGHSEAEDARGMVQDAAVSGLVGGAAGAAGEAVSAALGRLANKVAPALQDSADAAAARSVGIGKTDIASMKASGELGPTVQNLRDEGVATAFTTPGKAAERIQGRIDDINAARVAELKGLDTATLGKSAQVTLPDGSVVNVEGSGISGNSFADVLQGQLDNLRANPNRTGAQEAFLGKGIRQYRALGDAPISFDQAEQYVRGFGQDAGAGISGVRNSARGALQGHLLERAGNVDPEAASFIQQAGRDVSGLRNVSDMVNPAEREFQLPHSATQLGFQVAKTYGNSLKGKTLDTLAQIARTNPSALGKWGGYLSAAAARGPAALSVTHYSLSQGDPDYAASIRSLMEGGGDE